MTLSRRRFIKLVGLGGAGLALGLQSRPAMPAPLRLLAAPRSIASTTLTAFTASTGAPVALSGADFAQHARRGRVSGEENAPLAEYDLVTVPAHTLFSFIRRGLVRELGPISTPLPLEQRAYDPLNTFSLPAARGVIGVNARGIAPPTSWAEFFALARTEPAHLPEGEAFRAALKRLGHSINTRNAAARNDARTLLAELSSASLSAARLTIGAPQPGWAFALPAEGAELWEDCFCIPNESAQPDLARTFIHFALAAQPLASLPDIPLEPRSSFAPV